jgi:hypothetical protein
MVISRSERRVVGDGDDGSAQLRTRHSNADVACLGIESAINPFFQLPVVGGRGCLLTEYWHGMHN